MKIHHTLLCIAATFALLTSLAPAAPFAYVPNEKSGTISIIDIATDTVTGVIPAGKRPRGIAISPDGKFIYVSDQRCRCARDCRQHQPWRLSRGCGHFP